MAVTSHKQLQLLQARYMSTPSTPQVISLLYYSVAFFSAFFEHRGHVLSTAYSNHSACGRAQPVPVTATP